VIQKKSSTVSQESQKVEIVEIDSQEAQDTMKQSFSAFYRIDEDGEHPEEGEDQAASQGPKYKLDFTDVKKLIAVNGRPGHELI
jgi:hypothetical protein